MKGPLIDRAITQETDCCLIGTLHHKSQGRSGCHRDSATDYSVSPQNTEFRRGHMHMTTSSTTIPRLPAVDLSHQFLGFGPFGNAVTVPSMRQSDEVILAQGRTYTNLGGLLSFTEVYKSRNTSLEK
jgi:hypothetical protein